MMDGLLIQGRSPAQLGPFKVRHWLDLPPTWAQAQSRPRGVCPSDGAIPGCRVVGWDAELVTLEATHPHTPFLAFAGHLGRRSGPYAVASLGDALQLARAVRGNTGKGATIATAQVVELAVRHAVANPQDGHARSLAELDALQLAGADDVSEAAGGDDDQADDPGQLGAVLLLLGDSLDVTPHGWKATRKQLQKVPPFLARLTDLLEATRRDPDRRAAGWAAELKRAAVVAARLDETRPFGAAWTP